MNDTTSTYPAVAKGDMIRIVPEQGPERIMVVLRVARREGHHIITLADPPTAGDA